MARMVKLCHKLALVALITVSLCGCSVLSSVWDSISGKEEEKVDVTQFVRWSDGKPRIRPGVAILVNVGVAGRQSSKFDALVDQNGDITLPYLLKEPVHCDNMTLDALRQKLVKAYQEYIREPQVSVYFAPFDEATGVSPYGTVTVLGEVQRQGPVNMPPTMELTVLKALQAAGGFRPFADKRSVQVSSCREDGTIDKRVVDTVAIGKDGRPDLNISLKDGDVVWVPERWY